MISQIGFSAQLRCGKEVEEERRVYEAGIVDEESLLWNRRSKSGATIDKQEEVISAHLWCTAAV